MPHTGVHRQPSHRDRAPLASLPLHNENRTASGSAPPSKKLSPLDRVLAQPESPSPDNQGTNQQSRKKCALNELDRSYGRSNNYGHSSRSTHDDVQPGRVSRLHPMDLQDDISHNLEVTVSLTASSFGPITLRPAVWDIDKESQADLKLRFPVPASAPGHMISPFVLPLSPTRKETHTQIVNYKHALRPILTEPDHAQSEPLPSFRSVYEAISTEGWNEPRWGWSGGPQSEDILTSNVVPTPRGLWYPRTTL